MEKKLNIIFVDDELATTQFLIAKLKEMPEIKQASGVESGEKLMGEIKKNKFNLAILDYYMPGMDGLDICRFLRKNYPTLKIILHTAIHDHEVLKVILNTGAHGLLYKDFKVPEVRRAIEDVMNDRYFLSQAYLKMIRENEFLKNPKSIHHVQEKLSPREIEIMLLNIAGLTAKKIAEKIYVEQATVESHIKHIHSKTRENNIYGLIRYCINHQIFSFSFIMNDEIKEKTINNYQLTIIQK